MHNQRRQNQRLLLASRPHIYNLNHSKAAKMGVLQSQSSHASGSIYDCRPSLHYRRTRFYLASTPTTLSYRHHRLAGHVYRESVPDIFLAHKQLTESNHPRADCFDCRICDYLQHSLRICFFTGDRVVLSDLRACTGAAQWWQYGFAHLFVSLRRNRSGIGYGILFC